MPATLDTQYPQSLILVAASDQAPLAGGLLARHLRIGRTEAEARLRRAPSVLAEGLSAGQGRALAEMLSAVGLAVRLIGAEAQGEAREAPHVHLALQPVRGASAATLAAGIVGLLPLASEEIARALRMPGGMVLSLAPGEAEVLRRRVQRIAGLRAILGAPETARHDLFATGGADSPGLAACLRRLGLARCAFSGAIAAELDPATVAHVMSRFPGEGVIALNRAFQRHDLFLTGTGGVPLGALAGFLRTRGIACDATLASLSAARPVRIEADLGREAAMRFQNDYAQIGLVVTPRLHRPES